MNSDLKVMLKSVVEEAIHPVKVSLNDMKDNLVNLQEEQHAMRNDLATLQKDQHAMRNDLAALLTDQHAMKKDIATLQKDQHVIRNDLATLQNDQHAMRNDLTTLQKDQHAMRKDISALQKDQHAIKDEQQKMNTRLKKVEVLLNLTYEQTGHLTEKYQEISSKLENVAMKGDLTYFDKKISEHDRRFHKIGRAH